jgi:hypothetical protein
MMTCPSTTQSSPDANLGRPIYYPFIFPTVRFMLANSRLDLPFSNLVPFPYLQPLKQIILDYTTSVLFVLNLSEH